MLFDSKGDIVQNSFPKDQINNILLFNITNEEKMLNDNGDINRVVAHRKFIIKNEGNLPIFIKTIRIERLECQGFGF